MSSQPRISRRRLVQGAAVVALGAGVASAGVPSSRGRTGAHASTEPSLTSGPFELEPLPYPDDALDPVVSARTLSFHYGKHHRAYVDNVNKLVAGTPLASSSLEDVVRAAAADPEKRGLFNNAAQVWNHSFYWKSMSPDGGGKPTGKLAERIVRDFGSFETFSAEFAKAATTQFGSGWAWLVEGAGGKLEVLATANADLPLVHEKRALLTIDVWEHAYYLDHQNARADYVRKWIEELANWEFAATNLA